MLRRIKIVSGDGVGGEGIGLRAVFCQLLKGVSLLRVKHLMLQIVRNARRGVQPLAIQLKAQVHAAVPGGKERIFPGKSGLHHHIYRQPVGQGLAHYPFPYPAIDFFTHCAVSFPVRKYTVSSLML